MLKNFTPNICEMLLDEGMDIDEYFLLFGVDFKTPVLDSESSPTFGALVSCLNMCLGHVHAVTVLVVSVSVCLLDRPFGFRPVSVYSCARSLSVCLFACLFVCLSVCLSVSRVITQQSYDIGSDEIRDQLG